MIASLSHRPVRRVAAGTCAFTLALLLVGVAAAAAPATVGLGRATKFRAVFSTAQTATATGLVLRTIGRPPRPAITEAPAVRQTVTLPRGTRLRLAALPQCSATDALIATMGAEGACPGASRIGTGTADGILNGKPVQFDIGIYSVRGHLVFAAERGGKPLKQSFEGIARGARLVLAVPTLGGQIAPTGFYARIPARPGGHIWLRTPALCPGSGHWTAVARFQGVSSAGVAGRPVTPAQILVAPLPCR